VQSYRLKHKLLPREGFRLPTLEWLERANRRSLLLSVVLTCFGFFAGVVLNVITAHARDQFVPWSDPVVWTSGLMVGWLLYVGRSIIVPFVIATLVVYVIIGLAKALDHVPIFGRHIPGWARNGVSVLAIATIISLTVLLVSNNVDGVVALLPQYESRLLGMISFVATYVGVETEPTWTTLRDEVLARIDLGSLIGSTVMSATQIIGVSAVVFIYSGFILAERVTFGRKLAQLSSDPQAVARLNALIGEINARIGQYLALKTAVNILLGSISWILMSLVGVEFAAFWAVLIGFLNYIPYVGSFLGVMFPVALSMLQFGDIGIVLLLLVVLSLTQMVVGTFIEPYVMGNSLNLSPTVILLSLAIWSALWGILGAVLSVPITASLVIVCASFAATRPVAVLLSRDGVVAEPVVQAAAHPAVPVVGR